MCVKLWERYFLHYITSSLSSLRFTPSMTKNDFEPSNFTFAKLKKIDNYKEWERNMRFALKISDLWNFIKKASKHSSSSSIVLTKKNLDDDVKLDRAKRRQKKIDTFNRKSTQCRDVIARMCITTISQKFDAVRKNWDTNDLWEWLKKRYTQQNIASKWIIIMNLENLFMRNCKNLDEYRFKYY